MRQLTSTCSNIVELCGEELAIDDVAAVGRGAEVGIEKTSQARREKARKSVEVIAAMLEDGGVVYGVNTGFGGMSGVAVTDREEMKELQKNLLWFLKAGAGDWIPSADVRAAMAIRVNSFIRHGASAVRWELIERYTHLLNRNLVPCVRELGSIGASGDLVPLAAIAGAAIGLGNEFQIRSGDCSSPVGSRIALKTNNLKPIELHPKEGLALVNGTSMSTAIAANCIADAKDLLKLALGSHALMLQGLSGMTEYFEEYIQKVKPHSGQRRAAAAMLRLLADSSLVSTVSTGDRPKQEASVGTLHRLLRTLSENSSESRTTSECLSEVLAEIDRRVEDIAEDSRTTEHRLNDQEIVQRLVAIQDTVRKHRGKVFFEAEPVQDRYSLRCLPQYLGPILDGFDTITKQIEVEINSANDNPLVDPTEEKIYHSGNFLGQYTAVAMDQLRYYLSLLVQHLDSQIAQLVEPAFSGGLTPSLVGNANSPANSGLKGLQISANSIAPVVAFLGAPIADRFPSHAEQFNQNINSLSFPSARFARQSVDATRQYMAIALLFGVQAVELRSRINDANKPVVDALSTETRPLYRAVLSVLDRDPATGKPLIWNDEEQALDVYIEKLAADIAEGDKSQLIRAMQNTEIS